MIVPFGPPVLMRCPECDHEFTHLAEVATATPGADPRLEAALTFTCERGCRFAVSVRQRRGQTFIQSKDVSA